MDLVDNFVEFTKSSEVPAIFRKWIAISMVASALGRSVWTTSTDENDPFHPNLFVLLVAEPGVGKTRPLKKARRLMEQVPGVHDRMGPDQITPESLAEELASMNGKPERDDKDDAPELEPADMILFLNEFGNFVQVDSKNFTDHITFLAGMYDCPDQFSKKTKTAGDDLIYKPCLNILAGTQPSWFGQAFTQQSMGQGFPARLMLIYSDNRLKNDPRNRYPNAEKLEGKLVNTLEAISQMRGFYHWTDEAYDHFIDNEYMVEPEVPPAPTEPLLEHYCQRRAFYLAKIAVLSAASRQHQQIEVEDVKRAKEWMLEAEADMPKALYAAGGNKDRGVEATLVATVKQQGKISGQKLRKIAGTYVDSWRIDNLLNALVEQGRLKKLKGETGTEKFLPGPEAKDG
jgi:hypothetical protein